MADDIAAEPGENPAQKTEIELPEPLQRRNSLVFIANTSLLYFIAPVMYVGTMQAAIFKTLGASGTIANLPSSVYIWMFPIPVLIAWPWPV